MAFSSKYVEKELDGTWGFHCPGIIGQNCGQLDGPGFSSTGWPSKRLAEDRGMEHFAEHKGEGQMSELHDFRVANGLVVETDPSGRSRVRIEDI